MILPKIKVKISSISIMGVPGIEPGSHPRQGWSLPLAYTPLKKQNQQHLKTYFLLIS